MSGLFSRVFLSFVGAGVLTLVGACATGLQGPPDDGAGGSGGEAASSAGGQGSGAGSGTGAVSSSSSGGAGVGGGATGASSSSSASSGGGAVCGDGMCQPAETCMSCPGDCGACPVSCMGSTADCDGNAANGCECSTATCCGAACQTQHQNGLGQFYYDCGPLGMPGMPATYSAAMATAARGAWPMAGMDSNGTCAVGLLNSAKCIARATATSCAVWCYTTKALAGLVHLNAASNACACPAAGDPSWN